ncbi:MAG TPA: hypothetical protein VH478_02790 [Trebonia sp.]|jgi:hypothetical protein|nr:hypothetical protein [Trebonia sp.]
MLTEDHRRRREVHEISSDDLVTGTELAARLVAFDLEQYFDGSLRSWLFKAREELAKRGELNRIRDHLPHWITDIDRYQADMRPRTALPAAAPSLNPSADRPAKAITGQVIGSVIVHG